MSSGPQPRPDGRSPAKGGVGSDSRRPRVLFAHAGPIIAAAVQRVLAAHGFVVERVEDSAGARLALAEGPWDALVVDVALPGSPGFELTGPAREAGVKVVILVASVFRRTSYKRRPQRLYGADDYVEIHHLGDHLPSRLRTHLGLGDSELPAETLREVFELLRDSGDQRLLEEPPEQLASLIVADLLLYNGDRVSEAKSVEQAFDAVASDLEDARALFAQVRPEALGRGDMIGAAFRKLMASLENRVSSRSEAGDLDSAPAGAVEGGEPA